MDPLLFTIGLRMAERFASVLIGGLALYFGYNLFLRLPDVKDAKGEVKWRDLSVVLSRIGPGIFFALFGALVTLASFYNPIRYEPIVVPNTPTSTPAASWSGAGAGEPLYEPPVSIEKLAAIRNNIALLNSLEGRLAGGLTDKDQRDFDLAAPNIKLALIESVWDETRWPDKALFRQKVLDNDIDCTSVEEDSPEELFCYGVR